MAAPGSGASADGNPKASTRSFGETRARQKEKKNRRAHMNARRRKVRLKAAELQERASASRAEALSKPDEPAETVSPGTHVWQGRVAPEFSAKLLEDAKIMGLTSKSEIVRAALELLHRHAAELRMAKGVERYYAGQSPPLPTGVVPFDPSELEDDSDE
jgi:hypothetical protein